MDLNSPISLAIAAAFLAEVIMYQTDLAIIRIWTILVPIRMKKNKKNRFGPFSYSGVKVFRSQKSRPYKQNWREKFTSLSTR